MTLKQRLIKAIQQGELGTIEDRCVMVTLKEFRRYFDDVKTQYIMSFLPAALLNPGR